MPLPSEQILQIIQSLPEKDQRQVLDFAEFLRSRHQQSMETTKKCGVRFVPVRKAEKLIRQGF